MQAFILVILCLVFNTRLICALNQELYFCEHYAGQGILTREIQASRCGKGYSAPAGTVLVSLLCVAMQATWVLEQPGSSLIWRHPRFQTYTESFGKHMAKLLRSFNASPALRPVSMVDASVVQRLQNLDMEMDDWADAGLRDVLKYLYGAKGLVIPFEWKGHNVFCFRARCSVLVNAMALKRDCHSAATLASGVSFLLRAASEGDIDKLKDVAQELQAAINIASAEVKTEPGTESQLRELNLLKELLNKLAQLQAAFLEQKMELNQLRNTQGQESTPQPAQKSQQQPAGDPGKAVARVEATPRGSKRALPASPAKSQTTAATKTPDSKKHANSGTTMGTKSPDSKKQATQDSDDDEAPRVIQFKDLSKPEKEKVRRICSPKKGSGNLEVPENVFQMWQDVAKGRDTLFRMWCKSGGVKAVFMESLTIMTRSRRSKKLEVKGGFYSREDMRSRIEKIVAWAEKKGLVRTCEYDDETLEYWVNTRTSGTLTKEDLEEMRHEKKYEGENEGDLEMVPKVNTDGFDFSDDDPMVHRNPKNLEGDCHKSASWILLCTIANLVASQMKEYTKHVLKAKNSLDTMLEKIREFDTLYDEMSDAKAEGNTTGYSEKLPTCSVTPVISEQVYLIAVKYGKGAGSPAHMSIRFWKLVVCRVELLAMLEMLEVPASIFCILCGYKCCAAQAVPAKDLVIDARAAKKRDPCELLAKIANISLSSADEPLFALLCKHGLTLPIGLSWTAAGSINRYPFLSPKTTLEVLSRQGYFHRVTGVPVHLVHETLGLFWKKFRAVHPQHSVFDNSDNLDFERLIPYYLHGDGGRGYKKDPIEILSMFPALGSGSRGAPCDLSSKRPAQTDIKLGINLQGNSGATRFLFGVVSSLVAKTDPQIFDDLVAKWSDSLRSLFHDGFQAAGSTWRVMILGFTGDSPFVKKIGKTTRSFHNVRKFFSSRKPQKGCCWLCHAGHEEPEQGIAIPFEHLGLFEPEWLKTCRLQNPLPWVGNGGAILHHMLFDKADTPASFFRPDLFHIFHAGVGQDFTASALVYSMRELYAQRGVARNLECLNADLRTWMQSSRKRLHCGFLTEDLLGYSSTREFPEGKWSKNSDTSTIVKFVIHLLQRPDYAYKVAGDPILQEILECALAMGRVFRSCFQAEFFMASADCIVVIESGHRFLTGYASLVSMCLSQELCLFKLRPKTHYLNHVILRVYEEYRQSGTATNPCAESTFMSEDFVGRTARISRRVSPRSVALKTLQRYLLFMKTALDKESFEMLDLSWLD
ncbi:unnamed protein product [Symbiodinium sp. CCMP2592]|nr:unnamed protein product [Symbiodinium sp. CCMP2592]